ncbi:MAG: hypothetical protein E7400_07115 [Ruminococcaceae bacterium]|nr:hypothetical protein [Oscillospiraceae bacterium]
MADHVYKFKEVPKGQRWKFFWDYYKYPTLGIIVGVIAVISILQTVVFAPKKDISIIAATQTYVNQEIWNQAREALQAMPLDLNEDEKVIVEVNDNHVDPSMAETDPETYQMLQTKLVASLSTAESALQIIDEGTFDYFNDEGLLGTYAELPDAMGHEKDEIIKIPLSELKPFCDIEGLPEGLFMTLRPEAGMQIYGSEKKLENYKKQIEVLLLMMQS